jgi:phosphoglycerol transferase MdoB-like AlkP superfamily enzyme
MKKWLGLEPASYKRFIPVFILVSIALVISFITRALLLGISSAGFQWSFINVAGVFLWGVFYDLASISYLIIPLLLHCTFINETIYRKPGKWIFIGFMVSLLAVVTFTGLIPTEFNKDLKKVIIGYLALRLAIFILLNKKTESFRLKWRENVLLLDLFIFTFLLVFNAVSEYFFWDEFSTRYNFIAVDYLVYTNEVIGNIRESYPIVPIVAAIALISGAIVFLFRKPVRQSVTVQPSWNSKAGIMMIMLTLPLLSYLTVDNSWRKFSTNEYANELAGNGMFEFGTAFWNNELDFFKFYATLPDKEAFDIVRKDLESPHSFFTDTNAYSITRNIQYGQPENKMNVVLISVESLSASFMGAFGNKQNITPYLDSLSRESLFFTNVYASGTRTLRGLEALALSIPPSPGQSIVKRPDNQHMFSLGSVFHAKGYTTQYIYGGYGYFDNMNNFFSQNDYDVIDRKAILPDDIHYANIWGVADEDLFTLAMKAFDDDYLKGKPFFSQIMTVSNHRPYTYPENRIDIPPSLQKREGAVKYTDYAIGEFLKMASTKPWFKNTIFVIVADHCASSSGSVQLPVTGYHIPLLIFSPGNIEPMVIDKLTAQIDIAPTILGLLHFNYSSQFFGQDIFDMPKEKERAFISTYQGLGYLQNNELIVQSPVKKITAFKPNFITGKSEKINLNDTLARKAIAYYQTASWLINHHALHP